MSGAASRRLTGFVSGLRAWGLWPCAVMALSQIAAARALGYSFPLPVLLLTLSGTATMYGADRFLERHRQKEIADRHRRVPLWDQVFMVLIVLAGLPILPHLSAKIVIWLAVLGTSGAVYLAVTVRLLPVPPMVKEFLGAFCFTCLVWGLLPLEPLPVGAFFLLGAANFLLSSHADCERDAANGLRSLATVWPALNLWLARMLALVATGLFLYRFGDGIGAGMVFVLIAAAHALWPRRKMSHIDLAFCPLLLILPVFFTL